ncbi:MAG: Mur ligase family protein [Archaeoglobaceae archaeon]
MRPLKYCTALVVDMTHGGVVICEELLKRGCKVLAFDNHRTLKFYEVEKLKRWGVEVYDDENKIKIDDVDVIIVQHADPNLNLFNKAIEIGIPIISHARAAGIIISELKDSTKVIEITGTNGKTTVANMLAKILCDANFNVLIHDSLKTRIISSSEEKTLAEGLSITPANTIKAFRMAENYDFDFAIFEVSLGGTGAADVGIVTGIYENYRASFFRNAFNSKLQMVYNMKDGILILNGDNEISRRFFNAFFGTSNIYGLKEGRELRVKRVDEKVDCIADALKTCSGKELNCEFSFKLDKALFGSFQILNALGAIAGALSVDLEPENAVKSIETFKGVKGRAIAEYKKRGVLVDCSNRGINVPAIISALDEAIILKKQGCFDGVIVAISGSEKAACEIIDVNRLSDELKSREIDFIALSGVLGKKLAQKGVGGEVFEKIGEKELEKLSASFNNPIVLIFSNEA